MLSPLANIYFDSTKERENKYILEEEKKSVSFYQTQDKNIIPN